MSETPASSRSPSDAWLREALDRFVREVKLFSRTFAAFVLRPGRSARFWRTGERDFMNPLGFAASAAAVYWGVTTVLAAMWPVPGSDAADTLTRQIASAVGPYLHYGLLGLAMHIALLALRSPRRVLGSLGVAFFVGGSIGTLTALLLSSATLRIAHVRGTNTLELTGDDPVALAFLLTAVASYALVCVAMAVGLIGMNRTSIWKGLVAGGFAVAVTALLFGSVLPDGEYGWRPYFQYVDRQFYFGFRG